MKILLGGIVALVIGVIGLVVWWFEFLRVLKGVVPIILVLGGALAIYLGIEDVKTTSASPTQEEKPADCVRSGEDATKVRIRSAGGPRSSAATPVSGPAASAAPAPRPRTGA